MKSTTAKPLKLTDLAARIHAHLKRIEVDDALNQRAARPGRILFNSGACHSGRYVMVTYISYQGSSSLTRDEATAYLAWLDAGNVGTHYKQQRGAKP